MGPGPGFEGVLARERKLYAFMKSLELAEAAARKGWGELWGVFFRGVLSGVSVRGWSFRYDLYGYVSPGRAWQREVKL